MPSARIHEAIAKKVNKRYKMDELLLRIGTVSPDCWRNVPKDEFSDKYTTHFWNFEIKEGQANDYSAFYEKYKEDMSNPFYFGYIIHLMVDQYWKTYIDPKYQFNENGIDYVKLKDGKVVKDENHLSYYEGVKIQKQLAKIFDLDLLPTKKEELSNLKCEIEEVNLNGLFGEKGTLAYINSKLIADNLEDSIMYDLNIILDEIEETTNFVIEELDKLENKQTKKV